MDGGGAWRWAARTRYSAHVRRLRIGRRPCRSARWKGPAAVVRSFFGPSCAPVHSC